MVQTNTSSTSLGAVLTQELKSEEHPIVLLSGKLHPTEERYSTIECEALAVKWVVEAFQFYLVNTPFTLVMDHTPHQWVHKVKKIANSASYGGTSPAFLVSDPTQERNSKQQCRLSVLPTGGVADNAKGGPVTRPEKA